MRRHQAFALATVKLAPGGFNPGLIGSTCTALPPCSRLPAVSHLKPSQQGLWSEHVAPPVRQRRMHCGVCLLDLVINRNPSQHVSLNPAAPQALLRVLQRLLNERLTSSSSASPSSSCSSSWSASPRLRFLRRLMMVLRCSFSVTAAAAEVAVGRGAVTCLEAVQDPAVAAGVAADREAPNCPRTVPVRAAPSPAHDR